jgi:hypothetical protein
MTQTADIPIPTGRTPGAHTWKRPAGAAVRALVLGLLLGPAGCAGSRTTLASAPDFEVMTGAGMASVSIRQPLPGATDAESVACVRSAMERASPGTVVAGPVEQPFPSRRIVWHVDPTASRGAFRLMVNIFDGSTPYAYEETLVDNGAPRDAILSAIESMSGQLLNAIPGNHDLPSSTQRRSKLT